MIASISFPNISQKYYTLLELFVIPSKLQRNALKCLLLLTLFLLLIVRLL